MTEVPRIPYSSIAGLAWPALPPPAGQAMLALCFQLELSQWLDAQTLREQQLRQLRRLVEFAHAHVPHYRGHLARAGIAGAAAIDADSFLRWPVLTKTEIREHGQDLVANGIPASHGSISWSTTSGSTGQPLRAATSGIAALFQQALLLRMQSWYGVDPQSKLAVIRMTAETPYSGSWGAPTDLAFRTGPAVKLSAFESHEKQLDWLCREQPGCLIVHNANLQALLRRSRLHGKAPRGLRTVMGFSDMASPGLRSMVRDIWNAEYFDTYSCAELGPLALQCREHANLHLQSERGFLEVLGADGAACATGEIGRVVVTDLHNFAMPLIRYDLGDYARLGPPCPCGRGLPVLAGIAGRGGQIAVDPTGRSFFPRLNFDFWLDVAAVQQWQVAQLAPANLEVRYVGERELTADEQSQLTSAIRNAMRYDYRIAFTRLPVIPHAPGGKFDDFVSLRQHLRATGG